MDFTDLFSTSNPPTFSPGSTLLANAISTRIVIRSASTLALVKTFLIPPIPGPTPTSSPFPAPEVTTLAFSPNTTRLLAFCARAGTAFVFNLEDQGGEEEGVEAMLEGGVEGLVKVEWAKVGRGREGKVLLAWSELGLRLTIWDLDKPNNRTYIQNFKPIAQGHVYSSLTDHFFLAERHGGKDFVGVYSPADMWTQICRIPTPTVNLSGLSLSPRGAHLCVWDHSIEYKLSIHLPPLTMPLAVLPSASSPFQSAAPSPTVAKFSQQPSPTTKETWEDSGLGVRTVAWRPGGGTLAVGGWDGKVRLLESVGWSVERTIEPVKMATVDMNVWKESSEWQRQTQGRGIVQYLDLSDADQSCPTPCTIPFIRPDPGKPPPRIGVCQLEWNVDGSLLLIRQDNSPSTLYIYPFSRPSSSIEAPKTPSSLEHKPPTILLQTHPIQTSLFHPLHPQKLVLLTSRPNALFTWSEDWTTEPSGDESEAASGRGLEGLAECIGIPTGEEIFQPNWARWGSDGEGLCVGEIPAGGTGADGGKFLMMFEVGEDEGDGEVGIKRGSGRGENGDLTLEEILTLEGMSLIEEEDEEEEGGYPG